MSKIKDFFALITKLLQQESGRGFLLLPVFYGIGIAIYFSWLTEPPLFLSLLPGVFLLVLVLFFLKIRHKLLPLILALLLVCLGFSGAKLATISNNLKLLEKPIGPVYLHGVIDDIEYASSGYRLRLNDVNLWQQPELVKNVRINLRTELNDAKPGDKIGLRVMLTPLPLPVYPGEYDFARHAFFKGIGAIGYSLSPVKIIEPAEASDGFINRLRYKIAEHIMQMADENTSRSSAGIAVALLVGEQGSIDKQVMEDLRNSGLSHLLSISGLHMAIVMAFSFFLLRLSLSLFPKFALKHDIKKIAALTSLIIGFIYLLLAGSPVPAVRSYIMAALFFFGIIIDRTGSFMRPVALAAIIILIFDPNSLTTPSFQMSFAAVIGLIAAFESATFHKLKTSVSDSWLKKSLLYIFSIFASSLVASFATFPFVAYHFGAIQIYGIISNMLAIPLSSFLIMPAGMLSLVLLPLGLDYYPLKLTIFGIEGVIWIASQVSAFSFSSIPVTKLPTFSLVLFVFGALAFALLRTRLKYSGIALILFSLLGFFTYQTPDIIVDGKGELFAVKESSLIRGHNLRLNHTFIGSDSRYENDRSRSPALSASETSRPMEFLEKNSEDIPNGVTNPGNNLIFNSLIKARYARTTWMKINAQKDAKKLGELCDATSCLIRNRTAAQVLFGDSVICTNTDITISLVKDLSCPGNINLNKADFIANGTTAIWLSYKPTVKTVRQQLGIRPWNSYSLGNVD